MALFVINQQAMDDRLRAYARRELKDAFPMLSDQDQAIGKSYGVTTPFAPTYGMGYRDRRMWRWTFYVDRDGIVRHVDKAARGSRYGDLVLERVKRFGWDCPER